MPFHPGKVLKKISPEDSSVRSGDDTVQATVEMWDENVFTFNVLEEISDEVESGDIVLVDYSPVEGTKMPVAKQNIVKVLKGDFGQEIWEEYEGFQKKRRKKASQTSPGPVQSPAYMG